MDGGKKGEDDGTDSSQCQHRSLWLEEQTSIASQVVVLPDVPLKVIAVATYELFALVPARSLLPPVSASKSPLFGGVDVSFPEDPTKPSVAVYVILDSSGQVVYQDHEWFSLTVPYIPTFLAFRELEPLQRLVCKQLQHHPEVTPACLLVDGNGIFHPRGAGIASCLGVRTGLPTIGVGKTLFAEGGLTKGLVQRGLDRALQRAATAVPALTSTSSDGPLLKQNTECCVLFDSQPIVGDPAVMEHRTEKCLKPSSEGVDRVEILRGLAPICQGLAIPLACSRGAPRSNSSTAPEATTKPEILACALVGHGGRLLQSRKRDVGSKCPIYVSVGHQMSLEAAVSICAFLSLTRIPEPVRQADLIGRTMVRRGKS